MANAATIVSPSTRLALNNRDGWGRPKSILGVNTAHAAAQGLLFAPYVAGNGAIIDAVRGQPGVKNGSPAFINQPFMGPSVGATSANNYWSFAGRPAASLTKITVASFVQAYSSGTTSACICSSASYTTGAWVGFFGGTLYFDVNSSTVLTLGGLASQAVPYFCVASLDTVSGIAFLLAKNLQNGAITSISGTGKTTVPTGPATTMLFGPIPTQGSGYTAGAAVVARALTAGEMFAWAADPWGLWATPASPFTSIIATAAASSNFISQWTGQSDIAKLPPNRRIDDLASPVGYGTEFPTTYVAQWSNDGSVPKHILPLGALDNTAWPSQKITPAAIPTYASQWIGQSDVAKMPPNRRIDDLAAPIGYAGEFTPNFLSQWIGQSDVAHLPPIRPVDDVRSPAATAPGEFIANCISQWLGQTDTPHLPPPRPLDNPAAPLGYAGEFTPSFVSQWLGQSDIKPLPTAHPLDNALMLRFIAPPTPTASTWWMNLDGMGRWTRLPTPTLWDQSASYVVPIFPPPPIVLHGRCIYSITPNFTAPRPSSSDEIFVKIGDTLTWSVSFYLYDLIVLTSLVATVTIDYQTRNGPASLILPLTTTGFLRTTSWTVDVSTIEVSTARWTIEQNNLNVLVRGKIQIFDRFAKPIRNS